MKNLKIFLLLLAIFGSTPMFAKLQGQARLDSLTKELPRQKEDTNKVKLLNELSGGYCQTNPTEGIKYGQQVLELATKLGWKKGIAHAYNSQGTNYQNKSDYPKALEYFFKSLKMYEETGWKKGIAASTSNIGSVYNAQSDYPKALEYYFKALTLCEEIGNKKGAASVIANIAIIYNIESDYPKALEYDLKALKLFEEMGDKQYIANVTSEIGTIYKMQSDYSKVLEYEFKALKLNEELGDKNGIAMNTAIIGIAYEQQKNYIMAVEYMQKSLKIAEELGSKYLMALNLVYIGNLYITIIEDAAAKTGGVKGVPEFSVNEYQPTVAIPQGKAALLAGAIDHIQRALVIAKEIKAPTVMQSCYKNLSDAYKLKEDYKKVMEYTDSFQVIKDSIYSQDNREQIVKLEMKDQYGRQRLTDSLKTEAREKITSIQLQKQKSYTYLGIAGILLLAGFSFFIARERGKSENERKKSDNLLLNILPAEVATELKANGTTTAKHYDNVTVLFTDFVNFTQAGEQMSPPALIDELHTCFKMFDEITTKYKIEKIKTIGDAYLAVCGLPTADPMHAENVIKAAKDITAFMTDRLAKMGRDRTFAVRIGIHSGSVVAGIVGVKKFAYDIWGDTVNTAARMEQNSMAGKINISETTYEIVKDKFSCEYRGEVEAKGKGVMKMYFVS